MSLTMAEPCLEEKPTLPDTIAGRDVDNACWYVAYTQPRHEKTVDRHLKLRNLETYLPLYREIRNWNGRRAEVTSPLFPGYIFVKPGLVDRSKVLEHSSVVCFVNFGGRSATIADEEIDALKGSLARRHAEPFPYLAVGKRVKIQEGPLAGLRGTVLRRKGRMRMIVSVDFLQRSIAVDLEPGDLRLVA
jgi:transcription antitermination factor NusG